jgi:hypothetical protein
VRIDDSLAISNLHSDRIYTTDQLITILDGGGGGGGGGGGVARTTMTASYQTNTPSPTVFYTALHSDGSLLTTRRSTGITLVAGLYTYAQATVGFTDFIAVWDEGDVNTYSAEWIAVDQ